VKRAAPILFAAALATAAGDSERGRPLLTASDGFAPRYVPPAAGSYRLPIIQRVRNHSLLEVGSPPTTLFDVKGHRLAVVAFIYMTCTDATGCPLSQATLLSIDRALAADRQLARQTVLITVSFDPERDTPEKLGRVRELYAPRSDWRFVTSPDRASLENTLDDFGQPVAKLRFEDGSWSGLYRHVLKVFLLDRDDGVRNVYSSGFLDSELVLNDLRTLAGGG
jgi:cytochrome oxidase Cu insertion factor (SCO1/SenC/PrrC family)